MQKQAVCTQGEVRLPKGRAVSTQTLEEGLTIWPPAAAACVQPAPSGAAVPSQHSPADQLPFWSCLVPLRPSPD